MSVDVHNFVREPQPGTIAAAYPFEFQAIHRFVEDFRPHGGAGVARVFVKYLCLHRFAVSPPYRRCGRGFRHLDRGRCEVPASADLDNVVQQRNTEIHSPAADFVEISHGESK